MQISAQLSNSEGRHAVSVETNGRAQQVSIAPKETGFGSSLNGGELLFLALATCYCNDIYREAAKRGLEVKAVTVEVEGEFGAEGEPARNVTYRAKVVARADERAIRDLMAYVDSVAEIQNTLRVGAPVRLAHVEAESR